MKNCLQCDAELTHVPGRKEKSFCNTTCRNKYFYAKSKEAKNIIPLPADYVSVEKVATVDQNGTVKPLTFQKPIKKVKEVADSDDLKESIEWAAPAPDAYDAPKIDREAIMAQIKAIEAEKIPKERDTSIGRPVWRLDQQKRINELKKQL